MVLVAVIAFGAAAAGIAVRASYGAQTTADEPHYLLTALSLAHDGDVDVRDEFAAREYLPFHQIPLAPQARPLGGGRLIEPHDPLLPVLLAAPMALGGWVAAKLALCMIAGALAALTLWTAVRRLDVPVVPAMAVVAVLSATVPLAAYGSQVYPEIAAALCATGAVAALTGPLRRGGLVALALCIAALPWLSVKYVPVAAMLARRPRGTAAVLLPLAAGWFVATFVALTMQGWWFPARQLVVILPLAVLAIAWWARDGGRRLAVALGLGAVGVVAQAWIVAEGLAGRIAWVVDLQATADPLYRIWRRVLPDYLDVTAATWALHWAWAAAAVLAGLWAYRRERRERRGVRQSEKTIPAGSPGSAAMAGSAARSAL